MLFETDDAPALSPDFPDHTADPDDGAASRNFPGNAPEPVHRTAPPGDKLKTKSEFEDVKAQAVRFSKPLFLMLAIPAPQGERVRCGIICSRRFDKRAVIRNRARRLLWESFRLLKQRFPPCRIILIPRKGIVPGKMPEVKAQLEKLIPALERMILSRKSVFPLPRRECS